MDEIADLQHIPGKTFPQPAGEIAHDDRVRATAQAIWAAHDWALAESIPERQHIENGKLPASYQASDITEESMYDAWEEQFAKLVEDY